MARTARKAKPIPVEEIEEVFEELDEIEDDEEVEDLEDLGEGEEEDDAEELEDDEEEDDTPEPPRRKATPAKKVPARKAARAVNPEDPKGIIQTVLVDGLIAYMDQYMDTKFEERFGNAEEAPAPRARKVAAKPVQKAVKRTAGVAAKKTTGKPPATSQEVREWLQENGYEVSERGRISNDAMKFFTKETGRRIVR